LVNSALWSASLRCAEVEAMAKKLTKSQDFTIGVDLGGTKILTALVDSSGRVVHHSTRPVTPPAMPALDPRDAYQPNAAEVKKHVEYVVESIADTVVECAKALDKKDRKLIRGAGLASTGPMDLEKGFLIDSSNMKGWKRVDIVGKLARALEKRELPAALHKRPAFQNDAIAAALCEGWIGAAKGKSTYVMITVGTGIGTGVILNGQPAQSRGRGAEWGHLLCDTRGLSKRANPDEGSPNALASGTGLVLRAQERGYRELTTARLIVEAAERGDKRAQTLLLEASEALASLFYSLSLGFAPDLFVMSGGLLALKESYLPQAIEMYQRAIRVNYPSFESAIKISRISGSAGAIGAARLPRLAH
jgi:glucokinase